MPEACQLERRRVEIYDQWISFHSSLWWDLHLEELDLMHEVHEACPEIEFETPPQCADARSRLDEHRFWKMDPLGKTLDALRARRDELQRQLEDCEHAAKVPLLA